MHSKRLFVSFISNQLDRISIPTIYRIEIFVTGTERYILPIICAAQYTIKFSAWKCFTATLGQIPAILFFIQGGHFVPLHIVNVTIAKAAQMQFAWHVKKTFIRRSLVTNQAERRRRPQGAAAKSAWRAPCTIDAITRQAQRVSLGHYISRPWMVKDPFSEIRRRGSSRLSRTIRTEL
jgi:hypothetical protein